MILLLANCGPYFLPQQSLRSMCGRSRKANLRVLIDGIEELLELLERIVSEIIVCSNPDTCDDSFFDPGLVFFSKEPNVD